MSLEINLRDLVQRSSTESKALRTLINGNATDLSGLTTVNKSHLVAAINEVVTAVANAAANGGASINDGAIAGSTTWSSQKIDSTIDADVAAAVSALVNGAPLALDTLKELADALENAATDSEVAAILVALDNRVRFDASQTLTGPQQTQARSNIGAGTSNLAVGTGASNAKAGNWVPAAADISDASAVGRSVITSASQSAARTAIGAGTSNLALGTTSATAKAGDYSPPAATEAVSGIVELATTAEATSGTDTTRAVTPAGLKALGDTKASATHSHTLSQISDASTLGRSLAAASDGATARGLIGAGTSSLVIGTGAGDAKAGNYAPPSASATVQGVVELATPAEATTGTDTARAVTPQGLKAVGDTKAPLTHSHTASQISDSTVTGLAVLTAATQDAGLTALGGVSAAAVGNTEVDLVALFESGLA